MRPRAPLSVRSGRQALRDWGAASEVDGRQPWVMDRTVQVQRQQEGFLAGGREWQPGLGASQL